MDIQKNVLEILNRVKPEVDFASETELITGGVLDSFNIVSIINALNETFDIDITIGELRPENLDSAQAIVELVERLMD